VADLKEVLDKVIVEPSSVARGYIAALRDGIDGKGKARHPKEAHALEILEAEAEAKGVRASHYGRAILVEVLLSLGGKE